MIRISSELVSWRLVGLPKKSLILTMQYASISGKARNAVRSMAGAALQARKIDKAEHEKVLEQELGLKRGNEV